jgi:hypothetical protein
MTKTPAVATGTRQRLDDRPPRKGEKNSQELEAAAFWHG